MRYRPSNSLLCTDYIVTVLYVVATRYTDRRPILCSDYIGIIVTVSYAVAIRYSMTVSLYTVYEV